MKLIIGLGNPGEKYLKTRHNLGFEVVDKYVSSIKYKVSWEEEKKFKANIAKITPDLWLIKPQTYMNNSGQAVVALADYFKITSPEDITIIHDDLDLALGKIKVRMGGAAGGHHGGESIINSLASDKFVRVRLGIGNERSHSGEHKRIAFNAEHFVLETFIPNERSKVKHMVKQATHALEILLEKGLGVAQNQFN